MKRFLIVFLLLIGLTFIGGGLYFLIRCIADDQPGYALLSIIAVQIGLLIGFNKKILLFFSAASFITGIVFMFLFFSSFAGCVNPGTMLGWMFIFGAPGFFGLIIAAAWLDPNPQAYTPQRNKDASVIGRGVAGFIIGGPVGAMIGSLSAVDHNNRKR